MNITPQHIVDTFEGFTLQHEPYLVDTAVYDKRIDVFNSVDNMMHIIVRGKYTTISHTKIPTTTNQFVTLCEIAGIKLQYKTSV